MFVAVVPPPEAIEELDEFLDVRRQAAPFRWTLPEQWHLTLAFLEDVPDRALDDLSARLTRAAAKRHPMRLRIVGGGAFPSPDRAKVLWAGVEGDTEEVGRLAVGARAAANRAGVPVDGQRFRPHLTLARMRAPVEATRWIRLLDAHQGPRWTVDEVALVASHLGEGPRRRPRYELVETFPIGRPGRERPEAPDTCGN